MRSTAAPPWVSRETAKPLLSRYSRVRSASRSSSSTIRIRQLSFVCSTPSISVFLFRFLGSSTRQYRQRTVTAIIHAIQKYTWNGHRVTACDTNPAGGRSRALSYRRHRQFTSLSQELHSLGL